ncbi:MAG: PIN domain-containing protein [Candidatus Omnitrophica bacterium]|nr:PIN domain-containing protein [Candidatus Omnitrophota bacterium]
MKDLKRKRTVASAKLTASLTVQAAKIGPTVLLESSFVLALLDPRDPNHKAVKSIFGFLEPHNCRFHIPVYVFSEVFSKILQKEKKVSCALKALDKFRSELHGVLFTGINPTLEEILSRYRVLARKKIRFLQSNDFYIAAEGILSNSYILTCDLGMYEKVKRNYPDIYYVATHSKKYKDDIPRFTKRILESIK